MTLFDKISKAIQEQECPENSHYKVNGGEILADSDKAANTLADFLDNCGYEATTGYYDPEEDASDGCVDGLTGFWYIS